MNLRVKRIYEPPDSADGYRVLVDGIWPRGVSKQQANLDDWLKDIAPSSELRRWFNHRPDRWKEFQRRYRRQLARKQEMVEDLRARAKAGTVTLLYSARNTSHNQAVALKAYIEETD